MREEIEKYELFERFLKGELSQQELEQIQYKIKNDPDFVRELNDHKQVFDLISANSYLDIKEQIRKIHGRNYRINKILRQSLYTVSLIVISGFVFYFLGKQQTFEDALQNKVLSDQVIQIKENIHDTLKNVNIIQVNDKKVENLFFEKTEKNVDYKGVNQDIQVSVNNKMEDVTSVPDISLNQEKTSSFDKIIPVINISDSVYEKPDTSKIVSCDKVNIYADVKTEASCDNKASGSIILSSFEGGEDPYQISIDNGKNYYTEYTFSDIRPGLYQLFIKDNNNCITKLGAYRVELITCTYEFVFDPFIGEIWEVPSQNKYCKLIIFSKTGKVLFTRVIEEYEVYTWNGLAENGDQLPMGIYQFILDFGQKNQLTGYVTIVK